jgi:hypothetical protein
VARDIADAVDVSDRGSAELHHKASHDLTNHEPNYALDLPRADAIAPAGHVVTGPARNRAYTYRRGLRSAI